MTKTTTHIVAFIAAAIMTVATQGTMLAQFDKLAQAGQTTDGAQASTAAMKLETVTIVARRA